jgi:hypothetical protein
MTTLYKNKSRFPCGKRLLSSRLPNQVKDRTFRAVFGFVDTRKGCGKKVTPSKRYRNPIILAQEWQKVLERGECRSPAELARKLGVSRARVTQLFRLLRLTPEVLHQIVVLGDHLPAPIITERMLRSIVGLSPEEQRHWVITILDVVGEVMQPAFLPQERPPAIGHSGP